MLAAYQLLGTILDTKNTSVNRIDETASNILMLLGECFARFSKIYKSELIFYFPI